MYSNGNFKILLYLNNSSYLTRTRQKNKVNFKVKLVNKHFLHYSPKEKQNIGLFVFIKFKILSKMIY